MHRNDGQSAATPSNGEAKPPSKPDVKAQAEKARRGRFSVKWNEEGGMKVVTEGSRSNCFHILDSEGYKVMEYDGTQIEIWSSPSSNPWAVTNGDGGWILPVMCTNQKERTVFRSQFDHVGQVKTEFRLWSTETGLPFLRCTPQKCEVRVGVGLWSFAWGHKLPGSDAQSLLVVPKAPQKEI